MYSKSSLFARKQVVANISAACSFEYVYMYNIYCKHLLSIMYYMYCKHPLSIVYNTIYVCLYIRSTTTLLRTLWDLNFSPYNRGFLNPENTTYTTVLHWDIEWCP